MGRRRKAELFEEILREYRFGGGTIQGVAKKLNTHRRIVRRALAKAVPPEHDRPAKSSPKGFLFQVIAECAERAALTVTTNLLPSGWTHVFSNLRLHKAPLRIPDTGTESFPAHGGRTAEEKHFLTGGDRAPLVVSETEHATPWPQGPVHPKQGTGNRTAGLRSRRAHGDRAPERRGE